MIKIQVFIVLMLILLTSCVGKTEEFIRIASPNEKIEIVVLRRNSGGATSGFSYYLYLIDKSTKAKPNKKNYMFGSIRSESLIIKWLDDKKILIKYPSSSRIFHYNNTYTKIEKNGKYYEIKILLESIDD